MIDATEGQDVATSEIKGDSLQPDYAKGDIHIKMEVAIVNLIEEIYPAYHKDFIYIYIRVKMHVCRIQEGYIRHSRGITDPLERLSKILE